MTPSSISWFHETEWVCLPAPLPARALCDGLLQGGVTSPLHPNVCSCHMAADSGHQGGCSSSSRAHGCALSLSTLGQGGDAPTPLAPGAAPTGLVATQKLGVSDKEAQSQGVASVPHAPCAAQWDWDVEQQR